MSIWIKPNGKEIEINDAPANVRGALELGWKPKEVSNGNGGKDSESSTSKDSGKGRRSTARSKRNG